MKSGLIGSGRVVRRCWVNFQCRGVLLIWIIVGQGPIALAIGAGRGCLDIFSLIYHFSFLSPSLWETARYRLKNCLKGPLNPEQPTNQRASLISISRHNIIYNISSNQFAKLMCEWNFLEAFSWKTFWPRGYKTYSC